MSDSQKWLALVFLCAIGWSINALSPVLMPFVLAAIIAYLGDPLVDRLELFEFRGYRLNRTLSVIVVFVGFILMSIALLIIIVPTLEDQIAAFIDKLPSYLNWVNQSVIPSLRKYLGRGIKPVQGEQLMLLLKNQWQEGGSVTDSLLSSVSHSGAVIISWMMNLLLIPVIAFFLMRDWDDLMVKIHDLFPRRYANTVMKLASEADDVLGAFVRGQLYVMLALALIYSIGLWLVDLELALPIGLMAGLVSFVPYMGILLGLSMASMSAMLQFQHGMHLLPVLMVFVVGHSIESIFLTPWLVGNKIGLHPVAVIFAVMAGGQLFGFLGVLLALPVASVIMVLLRHIHERYTDSGFYSTPHQ